MYQSILLATDLSEAHFPVAEKANEIAGFFKAKLYLLHVIELPASIQFAQALGFAEMANPSKEDAITVMKTLGDALNLPEKQQFVEIGSVTDQLIKKVKELGIDLVIIGSHSGSHISPFLGSTANATVNHAPCDILTLKTSE